MYGSGFRALDDLTGELEGNSQSTFIGLKLQVSNHSSGLKDVSYFCFILIYVYAFYKFSDCLEKTQIVEVSI